MKNFLFLKVLKIEQRFITILYSEYNLPFYILTTATKLVSMNFHILVNNPLIVEWDK